MPKPEFEFFRPDGLPWTPVAASPVGGAGGAGVVEKILSRDDESGDVTRLLRFEAGVETTGAIAHDFWEEVWILEGELIDLGKAQTFTVGMYACRPPGMIHGPYRVPRGCTTLEVRSYGRAAAETGPRLALTLERPAGRERVEFLVRRIVNAGFTGRDQAAVRRHVEELRAHGVPCPDRTPVLYPKPAHLITTAAEIEVLGPTTSGEAEFVLLVDGDRVFVAAGSDHTDRDLETVSIEKAKGVCPNVLSRQVWDLADLRDGWDDLVLRSYVTAAGRRTRYQEGRLAQLLRPEDLLALVRQRAPGDLDGTLVYSGTVELIGGQFVHGERFEVELRDERRARSLRCEYRVAPVAGLPA
jgi:hypothetical protein